MKMGNLSSKTMSGTSLYNQHTLLLSAVLIFYLINERSVVLVAIYNLLRGNRLSELALAYVLQLLPTRVRRTFPLGDLPRAGAQASLLLAEFFTRVLLHKYNISRQPFIK